MAKKKEHTIISASTGEEIKPGEAAVQHTIQPAAPVGNAKPLRIGAVALWVAAVVLEVLAAWQIIAIANMNGAGIPTPPARLWIVIGLIVLDAVCVIFGAQLWKKANHIDPASEANPTRFWLWNNMGVIVACVALVPLIILMLANKNLDKRTKAVCTILAVIALLLSGLLGYEFNPISQEEMTAQVEAIADANIEQVYWTPHGHVYHTHEDCQALNQTETLTAGSVEEAIAANRTRLCLFCAKQDDITGVATETPES